MVITAIVVVRCNFRVVAMEDRMVVPQQLDQNYHSSCPQFRFEDSFGGKVLVSEEVVFDCRVAAVIVIIIFVGLH